MPIPAAKKKGKQLAFDTPTNTNVSKLVFDYVAGWQKPLPDGSTVVVPGQLPIFSNELNTRRWLRECVECKDNTFYQLLLLHERAHDAADRIYRAIAESDGGAKTLKPILRPYDTLGSTRYVDFDTTRPTYKTRADKCHVSHVVADTGSWEQKTAQALEEMAEVVAYVKNDHLGFIIPYTLNGEERSYYPDFVVRLRSPRPLGEGQACPEPSRRGEGEINLIVEVTGEKKKDKEAKTATARTLWVPAVNNHGAFGRWAFLEIRDPWNTQTVTREILTAVSAGGRNGVEEVTA